MKVKEVERSANISWSPDGSRKCYLAAATLAQQLDDTFSTSSQLELFSMSPELVGTMDLFVCGRLQLTQKMHRLVWTSFGSEEGAGIIIGKVTFLLSLLLLGCVCRKRGGGTHLDDGRGAHSFGGGGPAPAHQQLPLRRRPDPGLLSGAAQHPGFRRWGL